jgi:hypothetical protein
MHRMLPAPLAEFFELYFTLNLLAVFPAPIVYSLALLALKFYEIILRHKVEYKSNLQISIKQAKTQLSTMLQAL